MMFEEVALSAARILAQLFLFVILLILISGWVWAKQTCV